jgi:DNA-binding MarR family transcriptional regulator
MRYNPPEVELIVLPQKPVPMCDDDAVELSSQLCFATYAAAHAFTRFYKPLLEPLGLTYSQYIVLLVLWETDNMTVKEIGRRLFLDSGTLTPLLKRLEAAGIVRRTRDARDERLVRISLTPKGWDLQAPVAAVWRKMVCGTGLTMDEFNALKEQLNQVRRKLDTARG